MKTTKAYQNLPASYIELLAATLAEKLCFRVDAFSEWVGNQKITAGELAELHRRLKQEGLNGKLSTEILIAFVNNLSINTL